MIRRNLIDELQKWKDSKVRAPLILRGARQVGKSWLVTEFGKTFEHFIKINFEKQSSLKKLFEGDINISSLLEKIALFTNKKIIPGKTLLFIDEIQECEAAINYLRYFKEEYNELHVIAAGSLIDFKLNAIGLPVGRVDFLFLTPLSFGEYLTACGYDNLREYVLKQKNDDVIAEKLKELLHTYLWLGGMPEVVHAWITHQDVDLCQKIQQRLIIAYTGDFEKYAKKQQVANVDKIFTNIPIQFGKKFKYIHVDQEIRSSLLKEALHLLEKAGIVHLCYHSSANKPPLAFQVKESHFKAFFLDIGLAQYLLGTSQQEWIIDKIKLESLGALAEQFVAQEFVAYQSLQQKQQLYYWHREAKNSNAEVDFVITKDSHLIPIEVKSGKSGSLKSMHVYLDSHPDSPYGIKISDTLFSAHNNIKRIPLYAIESLFTSL